MALVDRLLFNNSFISQNGVSPSVGSLVGSYVNGKPIKGYQIGINTGGALTYSPSDFGINFNTNYWSLTLWALADINSWDTQYAAAPTTANRHNVLNIGSYYKAGESDIRLGNHQGTEGGRAMSIGIYSNRLAKSAPSNKTFTTTQYEDWILYGIIADRENLHYWAWEKDIGLLKSSISISWDTTAYPYRDKLIIAGYGWDSDNWRGGGVSELRIYNHPISTKEFLEIAKAKVLHYRFNDFQEPTTNVITITDLNGGWSQGYNTSIQWNDYPPPSGINSQVVSFIDSNGDGFGYWFSYGDYAPQNPSTTYTVSVWARTIGSNWSLKAYTADNSETGRQYTNTLTVIGNGIWQRLTFNPFTTPSNTQSDSLSFQFTSIPAGQRCWLCAPQMEAKDYATPFVAGSRTGIVQDNTGNGYNITLSEDTTPRWIDDEDGRKCYYFDGNHFINAITLGTITTISNISFWIKVPDGLLPDVNQGYYPTLFSFNENSFHISGGAWSSTMINETIHIWSSGNGTYIREAIPANTWTHVSFNWNGSSYDIYLNGEKKTTYYRDGFAHSVILNGITTMRIGNNFSTYSYRGYMSDVRIYSESLTDSGIQEIMSIASIDNEGQLWVR